MSQMLLVPVILETVKDGVKTVDVIKDVDMAIAVGKVVIRERNTMVEKDMTPPFSAGFSRRDKLP